MNASMGTLSLTTWLRKPAWSADWVASNVAVCPFPNTTCTAKTVSLGSGLGAPAGAGLVSVAATSFSVTVRDTGATSWFRMIACHVAVGSATTVTLLMSSRAVHVLSSVWPPGAGVSVTVILPAGALLGSAPAGARSVGGTGAIPMLDDAIGVSPRQMTPLSASIW